MRTSEEIKQEIDAKVSSIKEMGKRWPGSHLLPIPNLLDTAVQMVELEVGDPVAMLQQANYLVAPESPSPPVCSRVWQHIEALIPLMQEFGAARQQEFEEYERHRLERTEERERKGILCSNFGVD